MTDCVLPVTGSNPSLVVLALLAVAAGVVLVLGVRRRGIGGGAAVVVAFALAAAGLVIGDARRADVEECPPSTTTAPTTAPTTAAATTVATTATTIATTTTASTTTTTSPPTTPQVFPTTPTTAAVPDLTPTVSGPQTLILFGPNGQFPVTVQNVGTGPTDGTQMTFAVSFPFTVVGDNAGARVDPSAQSSADWTVTNVNLGTVGSPGNPGIPTVFTITSNAGLIIPAGASTTITLTLELLLEAPAAFSVNVTLPNGMGGETNNANNTTSHPVSIVTLGPGLASRVRQLRPRDASEALERTKPADTASVAQHRSPELAPRFSVTTRRIRWQC